MKIRFNAKKIAVLAILVAFGLISFIFESLFEPVPGAKLGLSNIFSLAALIMYSPLEAFTVVALRTLLGSVFAGNFSALMYSFTAGMVSCAASSLLVYFVYPNISFTAVSIVSAVLHNLTQYLVFVLLSGAKITFGFLALYLVLLAVVSGAVVGGALILVFRGVPKSSFDKLLTNHKGETI